MDACGVKPGASAVGPRKYPEVAIVASLPGVLGRSVNRAGLLVRQVPTLFILAERPRRRPRLATGSGGVAAGHVETARIPLPESVAPSVQDHLRHFPAVPVTLPWEDPRRGDPVTVPLLLTTTYDKVLRQAVFAATAWQPALNHAGVEPGRANGLHALRHFYASVLLDAGESIKAVAEWLGHAGH